MEIGETWATGVDCVRDGDVLTWDGRVVPFKVLVQRRWGWPKKAAHAAAKWIADKAPQGQKPILWVNNPWRKHQQDEVFAALPELRDDLCSGLARGGSKEALDADLELDRVEIVFDSPISDDGFVREVVHALALRFGASADDVRAATYFNMRDTEHMILHVKSSKFEVKT
jgi:hypothetical protein